MTAPKDTPTAPTPTTLDDATFSIDEWLSGATRPETVIMLSSKGAECGRFALLEVALLKAQKAAEENPDGRLVTTGSGDVVRIATEMDALAKVIASGRRPFRFRGLSEPDLKLVREATTKLDTDQTQPHLLAYCCVEPVLSAAQWDALRVALGEGQYGQAVQAATSVSFGEVDAPFSQAACDALSVPKP